MDQQTFLVILWKVIDNIYVYIFNLDQPSTKLTWYNQSNNNKLNFDKVD